MDSHTTVTYTSWGQRLQQACCGVCFGIMLFVGSFPLLVWNEGRSIERYQTLEEGRKSVFIIADPSTSIDDSREGSLVYMSGKAEAGDDATAFDPTFGVSPSNTLKLKRVAEMYQWEENKSSHTEKTEGGGSKTTTTYSYDKTWSDNLIDSSSFSDSSNHQNPSSMQYSSKDFTANPITVGSYTLSDGLVGKINWFSDLNNDGSLFSADNIGDEYALLNAIVYGNGFFFGNSPGSPDVGDLKINYKSISEGTVSLVAAQTGDTFSPYVTKRGGSLLLLRSGYRTADELFLLAERDNVIITWCVRFGGFLLMFIGLKAVSQPLEVVLDRIPCVGRFAGDLMDGATGIVSCIVAAILSILTIAIAWLAYRPLFSFFLFAIVGSLVYVTKRKVETTRTNADFDIPIVQAVPIPYTDEVKKGGNIL